MTTAVWEGRTAHCEFLTLPGLSGAPLEQSSNKCMERKKLGEIYNLVHFSQLVLSPRKRAAEVRSFPSSGPFPDLEASFTPSNFSRPIISTAMFTH